MLGQCCSAQRGKALVPDEASLVERMVVLAAEYGRYGFRRVAALLRVEGFVVNHKRVVRLWRREGLKVPQRQTRRGPHKRRPGVPDAGDDRRIHAGVPGDRRGPKADERRCPGATSGPIRAKWRARSHPLGQRTRVHGEGRARLARRGRGIDAVHRAWKPVEERILREL